MTNPSDDTTPSNETPRTPESAQPSTDAAVSSEAENVTGSTESAIPISPVPAPGEVPPATPQAPAYPAAPTSAAGYTAPPANAYGQFAPTAPQHSASASTPAAPDRQLPRFGEYAAQASNPVPPSEPIAPTPGAPYPSSYGTAPANQPGPDVQHTGPTAPLPPVFGGAGPEKPSAPKKRAVSPIAALVIGAIVGGAAGGGVVWGVTSATSNTQASSTVSTTGTTTNLVVNNTDSVNAITGAVAVAQPSVVTIESSSGSSSNNSSSGSATGSGVILTSDGYIVTNNHVVTIDGETSTPSLKVILSDGTVYSAEVVGLDATYDLAVIKIDASGLTAATFADSSSLNVGDTSIAIGAPLGLSNTVTDGIVSTLNRGITVQSSEASTGDDLDSGSGNDGDVWGFDFGQNSPQSSSAASYIYLSVVQTDAAINPGNSGGALVNTKGEVIGINVAIASAGSSSSSSSSGSIGVGFAIQSNVAKRITDEIIATGKATHGFFGASVQDSSSTGSLGVALADVTSGQAAAAAGLKKGDVITSFNGVRVTDSTELTALVRSLAPGTEVEVAYTRDGSSQKTSVTLGSYEDYVSSQASSSN